MAQRRMFSKSISNSSQFLMMPISSQNLYFHLGMNADDDGFCEHFTIMRMTDSKPDDLKILQSKGYVNVFDDKVLIITDWKENNYLRSDRYTESKYLAIYKDELLRLSSGIPNGDTGKDRIGKVRKGKDIDTVAEAPKRKDVFVKPTVEEVAEYCKERGNSINPQHFIDYYISNGWKVGRNTMKDWKATVRTWEKNNVQRSSGFTQNVHRL